MKNTTIRTNIYSGYNVSFQTTTIGDYTFRLSKTKFADERKKFNKNIWSLDEVVKGKDTTSIDRRWLQSISKKLFNQLKRRVGTVEIPEMSGGPFGGRTLRIRK